ncbi:MAG: class I SAM-dependent methyltransferase [Desulfovibrionaceae bacterium]
MSAFLKRVSRMRMEFPWNLYQRLGMHNLRINRHALPLRMEEIVPLPGLAMGRLDVTPAEYRRLVELPEMSRFRQYDFVYGKALEYVVSLKALGILDGSVHLDAASGYGEYAAAALRLANPATFYCLDNVRYPRREGQPVRLFGGVECIPLPDASVDTISCHHSIEHFKGDADTGFIREVARVLRPGGRACILPLFLASESLEIWNTRRSERFDPQARTLYDPFGTFPGWGPCERFARVYSPEAFQRRVLEAARPLKASLLQVYYDGAIAPNMEHNKHQAKINGHLKVLVLEKAN